MKELVPLPDSPVATFMKWKLMSFDPDVGRVRIGFEPRPEFTNPVPAIVPSRNLIASL